MNLVYCFKQIKTIHNVRFWNSCLLFLVSLIDIKVLKCFFQVVVYLKMKPWLEESKPITYQVIWHFLFIIVKLKIILIPVIGNFRMPFLLLLYLNPLFLHYYAIFLFYALLFLGISFMYIHDYIPNWHLHL